MSSHARDRARDGRWRRRLLPVVSAVVVAALATPTPTSATASKVLVDWQMNEPSASRTMFDSSANKINGSIGAAVQTGVVLSGATAYRWSDTEPDAYPPKPERLVRGSDSPLDPGPRDYPGAARFPPTP